MYNDDPDCPGDGKGGDLKSVGLVFFSCVIIMLLPKVVYEQKAIIVGKWPAFTCRLDKGEGLSTKLPILGLQMHIF